MLQVFNSRMCQLVLGAGAMQVSGLRSITAKHLALSSQCLSAYMALHPLLKPLLTATLPTPRLGLLLPEFDRLLQVSLAHSSFATKYPGLAYSAFLPKCCQPLSDVLTVACADSSVRRRCSSLQNALFVRWHVLLVALRWSLCRVHWKQLFAART